MKKLLIFTVLLIAVLAVLLIAVLAVPSMACDPGDAPGAAPSGAAPSAAPAPAPAPAPSPAPAPAPSPAAAPGGVGLDGGVGIDPLDLIVEVQPDCKWIINGWCVNIIAPGVWSVKGHPRGEIWYKVDK